MGHMSRPRHPAQGANLRPGCGGPERIVWSQLEDASSLPSGLKATRVASRGVSGKVWSSFLGRIPKLQPPLSQLDEASSRPSGLKATPVTVFRASGLKRRRLRPCRRINGTK